MKTARINAWNDAQDWCLLDLARENCEKQRAERHVGLVPLAPRLPRKSRRMMTQHLQFTQEGGQTEQFGPTDIHTQTQCKSLGAMQDFASHAGSAVTANHVSLIL